MVCIGRAYLAEKQIRENERDIADHEHVESELRSLTQLQQQEVQVHEKHSQALEEQVRATEKHNTTLVALAAMRLRNFELMHKHATEANQSLQQMTLKVFCCVSQHLLKFLLLVRGIEQECGVAEGSAERVQE